MDGPHAFGAKRAVLWSFQRMLPSRYIARKDKPGSFARQLIVPVADSTTVLARARRREATSILSNFERSNVHGEILVNVPF